MNKAFYWILPVFCVIALFLALSGAVSNVPDGVFYPLLNGAISRFESFDSNLSFLNDLRIPNIPYIPSSGVSGSDIFEVLRNLANALVSFLNGVVTLLNFVIQAVVLLIRALTFVVAFVVALYDFAKGLLPSVLPTP